MSLNRVAAPLIGRALQPVKLPGSTEGDATCSSAEDVSTSTAHPTSEPGVTTDAGFINSIFGPVHTTVGIAAWFASLTSLFLCGVGRVVLSNVSSLIGG